MPIRPEERHRYPADWPALSASIRFERAGGRCECRGECGRAPDHLDADGRCRNHHDHPAYGTGSRVILTTAHRDRTPETRDPAQLFAACQACHLHYDREQHARTAARTRAARLALSMRPLFSAEGVAP